MLLLSSRIDIVPSDNYVNNVYKNGIGSQPYSINFIVNCEIESSWEDLIERGELTFPKRIYPTRLGSNLPQENGQFAQFSRGDHIEIYLGYSNQEGLTKRFSGWITRISQKVPLKIFFEDHGFIFKNNFAGPMKSALTNVKVSTLLKMFLPINPSTGVQYQFVFDPPTYDVTLSKFEIIGGRTSIMSILNDLKQKCGYSIYFDDDILYLGFAYTQQNISDFSSGKTVLPLFHFQKNIISDTLEYFFADEIAYRINFININYGNTRNTYVYGDQQGEIRTLYGFAMSKSDIDKMANDWLNRFKFTGFRGTFTTFLEPAIQHGTAIVLQDDINTQRNGTYLVKRVKTTFGIDGGRQIITLDRKLV